MSGGGKGGGNSGPTDNAIRGSMVYPSLRDPVHSAIQDARRLYEQGYQIPNLNRRQQEGIEGIEDWASKFGSNIDEPMEYASWLSQGKGVGDAPGQEYLQNVFQRGAPTAGYGMQEQISRNLMRDNGAGYGSQENILRGLQQNNGAGYGSQEQILEGMMNDEGAGYGTMQGINQQAGAAPGTLGYLQQTASGASLNGNPRLDAVIGDMNRGTTQAYQDAVGSLEGSMSRAGAGVGGSVEGQLKDRQNQTLARELAGNEARVRYGDYGQERGYQQQAGMAMPGAFQTAINTQAGAAGQLGDMQRSWLQQQQGAAGQLNDMEARRIGLQQGAAGQLNQMESNRINQQQGAAGQLNDMAYRKLQAEMQAAGGAAGGYRADVGQAMQAGGMMPGLGQAGFMPGNQLMQTGDYTRNLNERQANQGWESFDRYMQGLGGVRNLFGGGNPPQQGPSQGQQGFSNLMGVGGLALGAADVFGFSDRRLKTDVEKVGGGIYRWRYIWGGPLYEGPMAQDVQKVAPHLVRKIAGYLAIPGWMIRPC